MAGAISAGRWGLLCRASPVGQRARCDRDQSVESTCCAESASAVSRVRYWHSSPRSTVYQARISEWPPSDGLVTSTMSPLPRHRHRLDCRCSPWYHRLNQRRTHSVDTQLKTGTAVVLPSLGESIDEATITRWLKAPGDRVEVDEPLLEVATDKVDSEIPSPVAGTLVELVVGRGRRGDRHHRCGGGVCQTRTVRLHTAAGADKYARVGAARRRSSLLRRFRRNGWRIRHPSDGAGDADRISSARPGWTPPEDPSDDRATHARIAAHHSAIDDGYWGRRHRHRTPACRREGWLQTPDRDETVVSAVLRQSHRGGAERTPLGWTRRSTTMPPRSRITTRYTWGLPSTVPKALSCLSAQRPAHDHRANGHRDCAGRHSCPLRAASPPMPWPAEPSPSPIPAAAVRCSTPRSSTDPKARFWEPVRSSNVLFHIEIAMAQPPLACGHGLSSHHLRPPNHRRCWRRPIPHHDQKASGNRLQRRRTSIADRR